MSWLDKYPLELRKQLLVLILIIFIPVIAIMLFSSYRQYRHALESIDKNATHLIRLFSEEQLNIVSQTRHFLATISHVPAVQDLDIPACNRFLQALHEDNWQYSTIVAADGNGVIDCCAIPLEQPIDVKDRTWFQRVIESHEFVIGGFIISRSTRKASLPFAFPILNAEKEVKGAVGAAYDLEHYGKIFEKILLPRDSLIIVTDGKGAILYQSVPQNECFGEDIVQCKGLAIPESEKGSFSHKDRDNVERVYWFERLSVGQESNRITILVGISTQEIYSETNRMLMTSLFAILVLASLCSAMAWLFCRKVILNPVNFLVDRIRRIQKGDLGPANAAVSLPGELLIVAHALDDMSRNLSLKNQERNEALTALKDEIAGHKKTVTVLREREEHLRILFEEAADAIFLAEPDGSLVRVNRQACRLLGYTESEMVGLNVVDVDAEVTSSEAFRETVDRLTPRGSMILESRHRRKDGSTFPVEITVALLQTREGPQILGIARDITERRKAESERENLQAQLQQAQKMEYIGRLAGGVAHDFNNVLGIIIGYSELALDKVEPGNPLYDDLQEIHAAAERSSGITRQLLAFARKELISPKVLDLNSSIEGMLKILRRLIGEDIDLVWMPGKGVWPILMDLSQLNQILANLCVNARDAIADVGRIAIETANAAFDAAYCSEHPGFSPGHFVMLSVSDDGCGMDSTIQDKIFEPFFTTKGVGRGTGLGLATVYGIIKQNNGFITVHSEPAKGAIFSIYLPRHEDGTAEERLPGVEQAPDGKGETVLLVEDEIPILTMAERILLKHNYKVLAAKTPSEALGLAKAHPGEIALLITDVVMPEMNGRELANQLQAVCPTITCLYMSGYTANVIAHRGVLDEGVHFIQKPFSPREFAIKVRAALDQGVARK